MRWFDKVFLSLLSVTVLCCHKNSNKILADYAFINGGIYTPSPGKIWKQAVAIRGDKIIAVGSNEEIEVMIGDKTTVIDLTGKMLMPGFIDSHIHPITGALFAQGANLQFDRKEDILEAIKEYAESRSEQKVIRGYGWRYGAFPDSGPTRNDLDVIISDRPVILMSVDFHTAWLNSKALANANITKDTEDPLPGFSYFQRDKNGEPTGWVIELQAIAKVLNALEISPESSVMASLKTWMPKFSASGITTVLDAGILGLQDQYDGFEIYDQSAKKGELPFRVIASYAITEPEDGIVEKLNDLRKKYDTDLFRVQYLKLFLDGTDANYTAAMLEPYTDKPEVSGELSLPESYIHSVVKEADHANIKIMFHTLGDRAARVALDAIDHARATNGKLNGGHALAHLQACDSADWNRFAKQNSFAQFSIQWAVPDPYLQITQSRWGKKRSSHLYPARAILKSGGTIAFGSDWPAAAYYSTYKPLEAIEIALTRRQLDHPHEQPLTPLYERFTIDEALKSYTINGASLLGMEQKIGTISSGKYADLVVLNQNLFEIPDSLIHKTEVELTMMNGVIRYKKNQENISH